MSNGVKITKEQVDALRAMANRLESEWMRILEIGDETGIALTVPATKINQASTYIAAAAEMMAGLVGKKVP